MKLLKTGFLFAAVAAFLLLSQSCQKAEDSSDVNQDKVHQYLELYYNSKEDKTYAYAQFRFGNSIGTPLKLGSSASISVDGNAMTWNETLNLNRYEWEWTGMVSSVTFIYSDLDGNTFTNTATLDNIGFPTSLDTISKAASYDLAWTGTALDTDDEVWVYLNEDNEVNGALLKENGSGDTSITITKSKMANIDPSTITIWMDRHNKPAISDATSAGGILKGRYRAVKENVVLTN